MSTEISTLRQNLFTDQPEAITATEFAAGVNTLTTAIDNAKITEFVNDLTNNPDDNANIVAGADAYISQQLTNGFTSEQLFDGMENSEKELFLILMYIVTHNGDIADLDDNYTTEITDKTTDLAKFQATFSAYEDYKNSLDINTDIELEDHPRYNEFMALDMNFPNLLYWSDTELGDDNETFFITIGSLNSGVISDIGKIAFKQNGTTREPVSNPGVQINGQATNIVRLGQDDNTRQNPNANINNFYSYNFNSNKISLSKYTVDINKLSRIMSTQNGIEIDDDITGPDNYGRLYLSINGDQKLYFDIAGNLIEGQTISSKSGTTYSVESINGVVLNLKINGSGDFNENNNPESFSIDTETEIEIDKPFDFNYFAKISNGMLYLSKNDQGKKLHNTIDGIPVADLNSGYFVLSNKQGDLKTYTIELTNKRIKVEEIDTNNLADKMIKTISKKIPEISKLEMRDNRFGFSGVSAIPGAQTTGFFRHNGNIDASLTGSMTYKVNITTQGFANTNALDQSLTFDNQGTLDPNPKMLALQTGNNLGGIEFYQVIDDGQTLETYGPLTPLDYFSFNNNITNSVDGLTVEEKLTADNKAELEIITANNTTYAKKTLLLNNTEVVVEINLTKGICAGTTINNLDINGDTKTIQIDYNFHTNQRTISELTPQN